MPRLSISAWGPPLFDLSSYARRGPGERDRLSPSQVAQIARTVRRVPEAVVKVLTKGSNSTVAVRKHLDYIDRHGDLELEADHGEATSGQDAGRRLVEEWDLDLDEERGPIGLTPAGRDNEPKLVHKLILSMPPGTAPDRLRVAAKNFLREEFALKHRYAFVLHTDEPHPHVHAVIKAVSEQGERLHIKKATLRHWRSEFAQHLRAQGIEANATERAVRGQIKTRQTDGIFRAERRGESTRTRSRVQAVAAELKQGQLRPEPGKRKLEETRQQVETGWRAVGELLRGQGQHELATQVQQFRGRMPAPWTDKEQTATSLLAPLRRQQIRDQPTR